MPSIIFKLKDDIINYESNNKVIINITLDQKNHYDNLDSILKRIDANNFFNIEVID